LDVEDVFLQRERLALRDVPLVVAILMDLWAAAADRRAGISL